MSKRGELTTEWLKERIKNNPAIKVQQIDKPGGSIVESTDTFLEEITADDPEEQRERDAQLNAALRSGMGRARLDKLRAKAEAVDAADQERLAKKQAKEEQQQAIDAQDEQQESSVNISDRASRVAKSASESVNPLIDRVGSLPTVGGIGLLVLILVILLFTVVRVNDQGDTRLKQLWYMLNGRATIKGRQTVEAAIPGTGNTVIPGGGVSGNFGSSTPPSDNTAVTHSSSSDLGF